jgi:hypothetical protein
MNGIYVTPNNVNALHEVFDGLNNDPLVKSILFFIADKQKYDEQELSPILKALTKPIIGGIFPELIVEKERKDTGALLIPLTFELNTQLIDLNSSSEEMLEALEKTHYNSVASNSCLFVFVDALSVHKELLLQSLFNFFGTQSTYIGGGAGSLNFTSFPCILNNDGLHQNKAIIGWAHKEVAIGVAHGWEPISKPLKVTGAKDNKVLSINWKPALDIYKQIVQEHASKQLNEHNFFNIAKSYPIGISKLDSEQIVRDPFKIEHNTIHFIDNVLEGEYIQVLHGNIASLLQGAKQAKQQALLKRTTAMNKNFAFCIDCISRVLYLQDEYDKELTIINNGLSAYGILSIGEIANSENSFLEIYNKTNVVAIW